MITDNSGASSIATIPARKMTPGKQLLFKFGGLMMVIGCPVLFILAFLGRARMSHDPGYTEASIIARVLICLVFGWLGIETIRLKRWAALSASIPIAGMGLWMSLLFLLEKPFPQSLIGIIIYGIPLCAPLLITLSLWRAFAAPTSPPSMPPP